MNALTTRLRRLPIWSGWAALGLSIAAYGLVGLLGHQPFHESRRALNYFDLQVYRGAAERLVAHASVYAQPLHDGLGFTYPPIAAALMWPLASASLPVDELVVTALNLVLLVWLMHRTLLIGADAVTTGSRHRPVDHARPVDPPVHGRPRDPADRGRRSHHARAWSRAAGLAAAAIWLEPISVTLGYGQINLLIAALVVGDLSRGDEARTKGLGVGLAAALKLTPLVFIPYLLLSGRRRAAAVATATFAATIGIAYVILPGDAAAFWGGRLFLDSARVGNAADTANQSLRGALARLVSHGPAPAGTELIVAGVAALGLVLAVARSRRGDEAGGYSLAALTALLASPISWTHHWTLAVPALILLARRAHRDRSGRLGAVAVALALLGYGYAPEYAGALLGHATGPVTLLTNDPYVLVGVLGLGVVALQEVRTMVTARGRPRAQLPRYFTTAATRR